MENSRYSSFSVVFFISDPLFWLWAHFWVPRLLYEEKRIRYLNVKFYAASFQKNFFWKISKWKKARPTLKIFGTAISSHLISFWFLPFSGHSRMCGESQKGLRRSRKIRCSREKKFGDILRGNDFMAYQKNPKNIKISISNILAQRKTVYLQITYRMLSKWNMVKGLCQFSFPDVFRTFWNLGTCLAFRKFLKIRKSLVSAFYYQISSILSR